jgi:anti-sigma-K factor RskA
MAAADQHPDLLTLDALRAGDPVDASDAEHIATCVECQAAVAELGALARELRDHSPAVAPTPEIDAQILWRARGQALRVRRAGMRDSWRAVWAVAAAAILVLASAVLYSRHAQPFPGQQVARFAAPAAPGARLSADVDGDGRVTVLDAFALARALERTPGKGGKDVNEDAEVNEHDVDAVIAMAVSVRGS